MKPWREARSLEPKLENLYLGGLRVTCQRLATLPHKGSWVPGLVPGIRLCAHGHPFCPLSACRERDSTIQLK
jgi:hypothetical protein